MFIVFDLDGTLADDTHRQHHITGEQRDWDAYFAACDGDIPLWPTVGVLQMMVHLNHRVEIWTGRSDRYRGETERWLVHNIGLAGWAWGPPSWCAELADDPASRSTHVIPVRMRAEGDHRSDTVVKGEWLAECGWTRPDLIFDDRSKSVSFWREQGITCYQVAQHDY